MHKHRKSEQIINDDKLHYFTEYLYSILTNMFEWEGLPNTVPQDYLEKTLIRHGSVLYYEDETIGQDILKCEPTGFNRHNLPTQAQTFVTTQVAHEKTNIMRNIRRLADYEGVIENFDPQTDGVLIRNMSQNYHIADVVNHYAQRLALIQTTIDNNLAWSNVPYIFQTSDKDTKLTIEKLFDVALNQGKPFVIVDKELFTANEDRTGVPTNIEFKVDRLIDVQNELIMKFKERIGIKTTGVDKQSGVNELEVNSNDQYYKTALNVMLEQREMACDAINAFFGQNISVKVVGGEQDGTSDSGIAPPAENEEI